MASLLREWKVELQTTPKNSHLSLMSLYDLFYDAEGNFWINSDDPTAGTKLEHDIICLNSAMLKSDNSIDSTQTTEISLSTWWTYGIDIAIPLFDSRAKTKDEYCNAYFTKGSNEIKVFPNNTYIIYDKDSALQPNSIDLFTIRGVQTNGTNSSNSWESYLPPSVGTFEAGGGLTVNDSDILLSSPDTVFKSTLVTQDGMSAYNRIMVNPYSWYGVSLVIKATGMDYSSLVGTQKFMDETAAKYKSTFETFQNFWNRNESKGYYVARAVDLGDDSANASSNVSTYNGSRWFNLLKNTFVWVRAPFYGDYVKPENFNQDLTKESKVIHSELMLSGAADFKKYDVYSTDTNEIASNKQINGLPKDFASSGVGVSKTEQLESAEISEMSMPYIPKTSPTIDIYTSEFLDNNLKSIKTRTPQTDDTTNYSSKIKDTQQSGTIGTFLDDYVSGNNPIVKGLPIAAINRTDAQAIENEDIDNLAPPNWFDPESRKSDKYYSKMGKFPTVVPNDGNLYVDGRIIGPTIDEIWIMLKKLTGGRRKDISDGTTIDNKVSTYDLGLPYGTEKRQNDTDTTMTEVPDSEFNFKYGDGEDFSKTGDPIDFSYSPDNDSLTTSLWNQKISIKKFINQNDTIVYPVYKSLQTLSDEITANDKDNTSEKASDSKRGITKFTAWKENGRGSDGAVVENGSVVSTDTVSAWGPREAPYSLRELEAMVMGNKYNIITQARFVKENFTVSGGLGKVSGDEDENDLSNFTAGSIFQMHKDYNYDISNPNTYYSSKGTNNGFDAEGKIVGAKATIDDNDIRSDKQRSEGHIRYLQDYGTSVAINENQEFYSSSDVYMSAFGDWRYNSDHVRIPILRGEYI